MRPVQSNSAFAPGAMTQAMRAARATKGEGPRWLRVGVLLPDGSLEERRLEPGQRLVVGTTERCDMLVRGEGAPGRHLLFESGKEGWILHLTEGMEGKARIGEDAATRSLSEHASELGSQAGSRALALSEQARGRVRVGETVFLFQLIDRPPSRRAPGLSPSARTGLFGQIDWLFSSFVALSILSHFGFVVFLAEADWPIPPGIDTVDDRVAHLIFQAPEEPVEAPPEELAEADDALEDAEEVADTTPDVPSETHERHADRGPARPSSGDDAPSISSEQIATEAGDAVEILLGTIGTNGAMADLLREGAVEQSQADVMAMVRTAQQANNAPGHFEERRPRSEVPGPIGPATGFDQVAVHEVHEGLAVEERTIRVRNPDPGGIIPEGPGDFEPEELVRAIRLRLRAIRMCYERELRDHPDLSGRLALRITVRETGTLGPVRPVENNLTPRLGTCVSGVVSRIRIRRPPADGHVTVEYPFVFDRP